MITILQGVAIAGACIFLLLFIAGCILYFLMRRQIAREVQAINERLDKIDLWAPTPAAAPKHASSQQPRKRSHHKSKVKVIKKEGKIDGKP